jgi:hypothetical protein
MMNDQTNELDRALARLKRACDRAVASAFDTQRPGAETTPLRPETIDAGIASLQASSTTQLFSHNDRKVEESQFEAEPSEPRHGNSLLQQVINLFLGRRT